MQETWLETDSRDEEKLKIAEGGGCIVLVATADAKLKGTGNLTLNEYFAFLQV